MTDKIVLTEEGGKLVLVSEDKTETLVLKEYGVIKETPVAAGMDDLFDVDTSGKDDDDILVWNASEGLWKAAGQGEATNLVTSVHGRIGDVVAEEADYALYYATFAQGIVADTALQPGDNVSELTNDAGYITLADVPPPGDYLENVVEDTTPALGGDLALNSFGIDAGDVFTGNKFIVKDGANSVEYFNVAWNGETMMFSNSSGVGVSMDTGKTPGYQPAQSEVIHRSWAEDRFYINGDTLRMTDDNFISLGDNTIYISSDIYTPNSYVPTISAVNSGGKLAMSSNATEITLYYPMDGGTDGQILGYEAATKSLVWRDEPVSEVAMNDLTDVNTAGLLGGHHLEYDAETMSWKPVFGGLTALGIMRFEYKMANPLTNTTPSGGRVGLNNTDPTLVTEIYFHKDSINGNDLTFFFDEMVAGDWVNIYEENNFDRSQRYDLTGPAVLTGEVYTLPVVFYSTDGAPLTANERVNVLWRIGGSIDYLEKVADDTAPALGGDLSLSGSAITDNIAGTTPKLYFNESGELVFENEFEGLNDFNNIIFTSRYPNTNAGLVWNDAADSSTPIAHVQKTGSGNISIVAGAGIAVNQNDSIVFTADTVDLGSATLDATNGDILMPAETDIGNLKSRNTYTYIHSSGAATDNNLVVGSDEISGMNSTVLSAISDGSGKLSSWNGDLTLVAGEFGAGSMKIQGLYYPSVDGTANQPLLTDGAGTLMFGQIPWSEIADKPTEFTPEAHTHVEDEITDLDRVRWRGRWTDTEYLKNDQVLDFPYLGVANKATTERVAPEALGAATWFHDDADGYPPWVNEAQAAVIHSGFDVVFNEAVELNRVRIAVAEISDTTNYRVAVITDPDSANPVVNMINDPILVEDDWVTVTVAVGIGLILAGTKVRFLIDALDSNASTNWTGGWRNDGTDITAGPSAQGFNRRSQNNMLRIDKTDLDSVDRTTDLTGIIPGSTVRIFETATPSNFLEYNVSETPVDQGTYIEYMVSLEDSSGIIATSATCTIDVSVPIPNTTDYLKIDDYWATNQPVWGDVTGFLRIDGVEQAGVENTCFGIDLLVQRLSVSDDWDVTAISNAGSTTGSLSVPEAPVDSSVYGRKDAAWTPVVETLVEVGGYSEDVTVLDAIDASLNNFATASGNPITITNVPTGAYTISIVCPSGGSNSIFSGLSVKWAGALSPTWTTDEDIVFLMTTDQGTTWYGSASLGHA